MPRARATEATFRARLGPPTERGCVEWQAGRDRDGYGRTRYEKRRMGAHQVAWVLAFGPIPQGLWVLHDCDNPPCCNPSHLHLGTHAENIAEKVARGRQARGERAGPAKLNIDAVVEIRSTTTDSRILAARFGVSRILIYMVRTRRLWKHVA